MAKLKMSTVKSKGRETENKFVEWMGLKFGKVLERRRLTGALDQGDITGWDDVCVEIKSATGDTVKLSQYLRELEAEVENSGAHYGFIAARPNGKPDPDDWYAVLPLKDLVTLILRDQAASRPPNRWVI